MSGGVHPLARALALPVDEAMLRAAREAVAQKEAEQAKSPIIQPKPAPPPAPPFDPDARTFRTLDALNAHLQECRKRGVLPHSTYSVGVIYPKRYRVDRRYFKQRPVTAADAAALQKAELKRRRKAEARLLSNGGTIVTEEVVEVDE